MIAQLLWHSPGMAPLAAVALSLVLALMVWLYTPQLRGLGAWARWSLVALRTIAIFAVVASVLQPVILRPKSVEDRGAIVILVDRSRSMSVIDKGRTPAEWVAVADALGMLPRLTRPQLAPTAQAQLAQIRAAVDDFERISSEAEYARLSGRGREAADKRLQQVTTRLLAAAAATAKESAKFAAAPELATKLAELQNVPPKPSPAQLAELRQRLDQAQSLLANFGASTDTSLYTANAQVKLICDQLAQQSRGQLVEAALRDPQHGLLPRLSDTATILQFGFAGNVVAESGSSTQPTEDTLASRTDIARAVRAIQERLTGRLVQAIVVFSDGRQTRAATVAHRAGVAPVFSVCAAAPGAGRDVAITRVAAPSSIFAGESATVRVELRSVALAGTAANVTIEADGVTQTLPVQLTENSAAVEFPVKFEHSGPQKVRAVVAAVEGELTDRNNASERWVKVITAKVPVMLISGSPSWDAQHLRGLLGRTRWALLRDVALASESPSADVTAAQLLEQSVVVLVDVGPSQLDDAQWAALRTQVLDRGGSVIITAGERHGARALQRVGELLPFELPQSFSWRLWREFGRYFRVDDAEELPAGRAAWNALPSISRFLALPSLRESARPLLVERETEAPVLIENHVGPGRMFLLGTDESWRWRGVGSGDEQFWQQLIRYACDEPYAVHRGELQLDADKVAAEPGESIRVRARIATTQNISSTQPAPRLQLLRDGRTLQDLPMQSSSAGALFEVSLKDVPAGDLVLQLRAAGDQAAELPLRVAEVDETEMSDLSGDERVLRRIAEASGGAFMRLDQVNALPQKLAAARDAQSAYLEYPLWDSPYLFLFVVGALGAEWSLRKRFGLV